MLHVRCLLPFQHSQRLSDGTTFMKTKHIKGTHICHIRSNSPHAVVVYPLLHEPIQYKTTPKYNCHSLTPFLNFSYDFRM
jgi:hypothetical protein